MLYIIYYGSILGTVSRKRANSITDIIDFLIGDGYPTGITLSKERTTEKNTQEFYNF